MDKTGERETEGKVPPMAKVRREESQRKPKDESESPQAADAAPVSVGPLAPMPTKARPDWAKWRSKKQALLWEACALACDMDPAHVDLADLQDEKANVQGILHLLVKSEDAGIMIRIVQRDAGGHPWFDTILLDSFAAWAAATGCALPAGFPHQKAATESLEERPLDPRERRTLLAIIAALAHAKGIDFNHPSTAATKIAHLTNNMKQGLSERTILNHLNEIRRLGLHEVDPE